MISPNCLSFQLTLHMKMIISEKSVALYSIQRIEKLKYTPPTTILESDENIFGHFLFDKDNIDEKKDLLFPIWNIGQHQIKTIQIK